MNRLWICLPRCSHGTEHLQRYGVQARFRFSKRVQNRHASIFWQQGGTQLKINSPAARYLQVQRRQMAVSGDWHPQLTKIIVKDYAVLARLSQKSGVDTTEGHLHDYYVTGIRGLGTWGAAWMLDRRYSLLTTYEKEDDLQMLLEVEYRNGKVFDVKDVSNEKQSYFDEQNDVSFINSTVRTFQH